MQQFGNPPLSLKIKINNTTVNNLQFSVFSKIDENLVKNVNKYNALFWCQKANLVNWRSWSLNKYVDSLFWWLLVFLRRFCSATFLRAKCDFWLEAANMIKPMLQLKHASPIFRPTNLEECRTQYLYTGYSKSM